MCSWPWQEQHSEQEPQTKKLQEPAGVRNGDSEAAFNNTNFWRRQLKVLIMPAYSKVSFLFQVQETVSRIWIRM